MVPKKRCASILAGISSIPVPDNTSTTKLATKRDTTYAKIRISAAAIICGMAFIISYNIAVAGCEIALIPNASNATINVVIIMMAKTNEPSICGKFEFFKKPIFCASCCKFKPRTKPSTIPRTIFAKI